MTAIEKPEPRMFPCSRAHHGVNLASAGLGAKALWPPTSFFGPLDRMLSDAPAVFVEGKVSTITASGRTAGKPAAPRRRA